jgi:hypothetical protein
MKGMFVDTNLTAISTWMTYFVQIALGYLTTRGLCALIDNPRIRLRLWGCFLFLTTAGWTIFGVQVSADSSVPLTNGSLPVMANRGQWGLAPVPLHRHHLHASTALEVAATQEFSTGWPNSFGGGKSTLSKTLPGDEGSTV